jgi:diguanylate cyclase (GGDEF)-like protein/PAS domain S-box-containing protein
VDRRDDLDFFTAHNRTLIKTLSDMSVRMNSALKLLSAIAAMSEAPVKQANLKQGAQEILQHLVRGLEDVENCSLLLYDPERDRLRLLAALGQADLLESHKGSYNRRLSFRPGEGVAGMVFSERRACFWDGDAPEADWIKPDANRPLPPSLACLPLETQEGPLGVLNVSFALRVEFDVPRRRDLILLSGVVANVLQSFILGRELKSHAASLKAQVRQYEREVRERRRAEEALRASEERFRGLSHNAPDIVYSLDTKGAFTYVNPAWQRILGHPPEYVLGRYFTDFAEPAAAKRYVELFKRVRDGKQTLNGVDGRLLTKDGQLRFFSLSASPNLDAQGAVTGLVGLFTDITERKLAEQALRRSRSRLTRAQTMAHLGNWELELASGLLTCSEEVFSIFGLPDRLGAVPISDFLLQVHHEDRQVVREKLGAAGEEGQVSLEHRIVRPGGAERVVHELAEVERDEAGKAVKLVGAVQDITELRRSEEQMRLLARVFENTIEGIMVTDAQGVIEMVNRAFTAITGYESAEAVGKTPRLLSSQRQAPEFYRQMWAALERDGHWQGELWNRRKNGEAYPEWLTITAIKDSRERVTHFVGVFHDITDIKLSEEKIRHLAYHDALTSLPNRLLFNDRLTMAMAHAKRHRQKVAVIFLDLDNFKNVNDSLGHAVGDQLLQAVAQRLVRWTRLEDTVARLGGDEFIVLAQGAEGPDFAAHLASRMLDSLREPFLVGGQELYINGSIGVTLYPDDGLNPESLVANADTAMYRAKESGRGGYKLFTPAMNARVVQRLAMESSLRKALERGEFLLHYQPKVELATGRLVGLEALVRWQRPDGGLVMPDDFIPVSEDTGLIVPLGQWVLTQACASARGWLDRGLEGLHVAVNISPRQFQEKSLVATVRRALAESRLPPASLELEVTESVVMHSVDEAIVTLRELSELGVRLSMDDFGRGYSSLYYLKRFPMHSLKIDRSFVGDLGNGDDASIVHTIISMSRSLGLKVVAEGVETVDQLEFLRRNGCDLAQGYLLGRPQPDELVPELVLGWPARRDLLA